MKRQRKNQANQLARECMVTALMQLLKEKPLSAVSVSELTEKAGVSRMTYYRNYQSKEEIFTVYLDDILDDYRDDVKNLFQKGNYYDLDNLIHCFSYFRQHRLFLESLFQSGLGHTFLESVGRYVVETWYRPGDGIEHYYALQAFTGALYNLYISWSENGAKESPEEMARILYRIYAEPAN